MVKEKEGDEREIWGYNAPQIPSAGQVGTQARSETERSLAAEKLLVRII